MAVAALVGSVALAVLALTPVRRELPAAIVVAFVLPGVAALVIATVVTWEHEHRWSALPRWAHVLWVALYWPALILSVLGITSYSSDEGREALEAFAPWWALAGGLVSYRAVLLAWGVARRADAESWDTYGPRTGA